MKNLMKKVDNTHRCMIPYMNFLYTRANPSQTDMKLFINVHKTHKDISLLIIMDSSLEGL